MQATNPGKRLDAGFYQRHNVLGLSRALLGKFLVSEWEGQRTAGMIVETEAYRGADDKACHAYPNRRTTRTEIMYGAPGHAYVYLCYGIHHLFNVVSGPPEEADAVLIRAIEPADNTALMLERRGKQRLGTDLTAGPGRLTQALRIDRRYNGTALFAASAPIWIEDRNIVFSDDRITAGPRIGIAYAEECANWPWRFYIAGHPWVSK